MELSEATALIEKAVSGVNTPQRWADLGCGPGLFTRALASLLPEGSLVYGVDTEPGIEISQTPGGVDLLPVQADFMEDTLELYNLDGILFSNSLHYVPDPLALIHKLEHCFSGEPRFLMVEYDTDTPVHTWVPYPLSFASFENLFRQADYHTIKEAGRRDSIYGDKPIYAALAVK